MLNVEIALLIDFTIAVKTSEVTRLGKRKLLMKKNSWRPARA